MGTNLLMVVIMFAVPLGWFLLLWMLDWLEDRTLVSDERAEKISSLLETSGPETIEIEVARMLDGSIRGRAASRSPSSGTAP